jgi:hypothetical protein
MEQHAVDGPTGAGPVVFHGVSTSMNLDNLNLKYVFGGRKQPHFAKHVN